MGTYLDQAGGNPSSIHAEGRGARDAVETARRQVADMIEVGADGIVFCSGGTEANGLGIRGLVRAAGGPGIVVTTELEHPSSLETARSQATDLRLVSVTVDGTVALSELERHLDGPGVLVMQLANHEIGTIQDVAGMAELAHSAGFLVHCDAVQAAGKLAIDAHALGVDTLALSGHKLGGPQGVGALWSRSELPTPLENGGHQERGRRPGTENVVGIVGMGAACADIASRLEAMSEVSALRDGLEERLISIDGARVHGSGAQRVGNTVSVAFAGAAGEVLVQALDIAGVAASTGAACTSGTLAPSPVLLALGFEAAQAREALRLSLGPENRGDDLDGVAEITAAAVRRAREFSL